MAVFFIFGFVVYLLIINFWNFINGLSNIFLRSLYIQLLLNIKGTMIPIKNHPIMSVGRCTHTMILENHMINENNKKIIHSQVYFLSFCLIHRISSHIANHIDMAAWSDGNELLGKNLCRIVSDSSCPNSNTLGLDLLKKNWVQMFIIEVIIADRNIRRADSLILSFCLIIHIMYMMIKTIGNKNTKTSAVIGIIFNKRSWYFMYSFNDVIRFIHREGSCSGNIIFQLIIKIFYIYKF